MTTKKPVSQRNILKYTNYILDDFEYRFFQNELIEIGTVSVCGKFYRTRVRLRLLHIIKIKSKIIKKMCAMSTKLLRNLMVC